MIDLKDNEAVRFGGKLLVKPPMGKTKFVTDGEETIVDVGYSTKPMIISDITEVYKIVFGGGKRLSHYSNGLESISGEEFHCKLSDLQDKYREFYFTNDDGEYNFYGDIDKEYEFKKELRNIQDGYKPVYVNEDIQWGLLEFNIIGELCDTRSPYISNSLSVGKKSFKQYEQSIFKVDLTLAAYNKWLELSEKYGAKTIRFNNDSKYRYIKFAQISQPFHPKEMEFV